MKIVILLLKISFCYSFFKTNTRLSTFKSSKYSTTIDVVDDIVLQEKLPWQENGYQSWEWNNHKINYVEMGNPKDPPVILIHGFGASVYHWRYNIPNLAKDHHVFAIDMLGFGLSDKPLLDYSAELWRDQLLTFITDVVRTSRGDTSPCVVAGNSLGGFTALYAASSAVAGEKNLINGCVLLNAAGRFKEAGVADKSVDDRPSWLKNITAFIQRLVITSSFYYTKQPARISQVLRQVYIDTTNVDDELVQSIEFASRNPNAAEVFYRVIVRTSSGPAVYIDDLVATLKVPLLLLWGEKDPWIRPIAADKIQSMYPSSQRVSLDAGHCPQDEVPEEVNDAISKFVKTCSTFRL